MGNHYSSTSFCCGKKKKRPKGVSMYDTITKDEALLLLRRRLSNRPSLTPPSHYSTAEVDQHDKQAILGCLQPSDFDPFSPTPSHRTSSFTVASTSIQSPAPLSTSSLGDTVEWNTIKIWSSLKIERAQFTENTSLKDATALPNMASAVSSQSYSSVHSTLTSQYANTDYGIDLSQVDVAACETEIGAQLTRTIAFHQDFAKHIESFTHECAAKASAADMAQGFINTVFASSTNTDEVHARLAAMHEASVQARLDTSKQKRFSRSDSTGVVNDRSVFIELERRIKQNEFGGLTPHPVLNITQAIQSARTVSVDKLLLSHPISAHFKQRFVDFNEASFRKKWAIFKGPLLTSIVFSWASTITLYSPNPNLLKFFANVAHLIKALIPTIVTSKSFLSALLTLFKLNQPDKVLRNEHDFTNRLNAATEPLSGLFCSNDLTTSTVSLINQVAHTVGLSESHRYFILRALYANSILHVSNPGWYNPDSTLENIDIHRSAPSLSAIEGFSIPLAKNIRLDLFEPISKESNIIISRLHEVLSDPSGTSIDATAISTSLRRHFRFGTTNDDAIILSEVGILKPSPRQSGNAIRTVSVSAVSSASRQDFATANEKLQSAADGWDFGLPKCRFTSALRNLATAKVLAKVNNQIKLVLMKEIDEIAKERKDYDFTVSFTSWNDRSEKVFAEVYRDACKFLSNPANSILSSKRPIPFSIPYYDHPDIPRARSYIVNSISRSELLVKKNGKVPQKLIVSGNKCAVATRFSVGGKSHTSIIPTLIDTGAEISLFPLEEYVKLVDANLNNESEILLIEENTVHEQVEFTTADASKAPVVCQFGLVMKVEFIDDNKAFSTIDVRFNVTDAVPSPIIGTNVLAQGMSPVDLVKSLIGTERLSTASPRQRQ